MAQHETCVKRCCLIIMELCLVEYLRTLFQIEPQSVPKTVLGVMISYVFGGPTFI